MSKPLVKHFGYVKGGRKYYHNPERYKAQIALLEGKEFIEIIEKKSERRTISQNNYYRGIILEECLKSEYFYDYPTKEDIHEEVFEKMFLRYVVERVVGGVKKNVEKYYHTSSLSKEDYGMFITKVLHWCDEHRIVVLDSEEYYLKKAK